MVSEVNNNVQQAKVGSSIEIHQGPQTLTSMDCSAKTCHPLHRWVPKLTPLGRSIQMTMQRAERRLFRRILLLVPEPTVNVNDEIVLHHLLSQAKAQACITRCPEPAVPINQNFARRARL